MRAHSTIVLSCSPKGGVAKTYDIIGVSELAAEAVEPFGLPAVLLDMNLVNPDLREALGLSADAPAVRGLVDAVSHGKEPAAGATPVGSNLQVYVGSREADGYSLAQIDRLASVARARWALTAVDLANCLPDATGSDAAAVFSHWLRYADVLMIPADPTPAAFAGLLSLLDSVREQVEAGVLQQMPGVIVPILVHPGGEALRDSRIVEMLDHLRTNGLRVVTVPVSEDVQLAAWPWRDTSIVTADARVRDAYWETLHAMVDAREERE